MLLLYIFPIYLSIHVVYIVHFFTFVITCCDNIVIWKKMSKNQVKKYHTFSGMVFFLSFCSVITR